MKSRSSLVDIPRLFMAAMMSLVATCFAHDNLVTYAKVELTENAIDEGLPAYKIETPAVTWFLEKSGAGLSSLIDRDGNDWLGFHPEPGSGAAGEYRGFPNAIHKQAGNYFHPKNNSTDPATTRIEHVAPDRVTISATSGNGRWGCRYDFLPTHCTFTMTRMPPDRRYWVLYEGTPGGRYDDDDWWMTSTIRDSQQLTQNHNGDIPGPEWIVFGDRRYDRVLFLVHHEDDEHPDRFYAMQKKMTVFGFGRDGVKKFLKTVPQQFSIGLIESTDYKSIRLKLESLPREVAREPECKFLLSTDGSIPPTP